MIAVVYSGSKSACWKIWQKDKPTVEATTTSINPSLYDAKQITQMLSKNIHLIHHAESIKKIYVYAAGASTKPKQDELSLALQGFFIHSKIKVNDDVQGAALAVCDDKPGIVGILGSGANCAYYNGKKIKANNFGLGYILADEGSSNYLGKMLLKYYLEDKLPNDLITKLNSKYSLDRGQILERIYRKPNVQSYLSSYLEFFTENYTHKFIQQMIDDGFDKYMSTYIVPISKKYPNEEIHFVGTVAGQFQDRLRSSAHRHGIEIMSVIKEPWHNILNYYIN
jgi:hypothetical protein